MPDVDYLLEGHTLGGNWTLARSASISRLDEPDCRGMARALPLADPPDVGPWYGEACWPGARCRRG